MPFRQTRHRTWPILTLVLLLPFLTVISLAHGPVTSPWHASKHTRQTVLAPYVTPSATPTTSSNDGLWVVRASYDDRQMVNALAAWREPWEVHHEEGYLVLDVNREEFERLQEAGFDLEIDEQLTMHVNRLNTALPGQVTGIPGFPCYRTVEETFAAAEAINANHPELATWIDIGDSWEKATPGGDAGHDMMVLRLTNSAHPGPKPKLFIMSSLHAREYAPAELSARFAEHLVDNYGSDPDITWLLDHHEIHLLLQANPDGRKRAEMLFPWWRKNTNNNFCSYTPLRGVDLNRNFGFQWNCCGGSSSSECAETFHGPGPTSEPETQAIQDYVRAEFPDQRSEVLTAAAPITATGVFLDIHSYSELVIWPWGFSEAPAPNSDALQTLGRKLAYFNDYIPQQAYELYPTDGTADNFAYGELGLAAYTFELGTMFLQDCVTFENAILPENLPALIYAAKAARTPYMTPAGPDAQNLILTPEIADFGESSRLTAIINDTRYNGQNGIEPAQNIAAAEYYIDIPPWITSTTPIAYPLMAVDGTFDEAIEEVEATIETRALRTGRHIIFVRGQDTDGNWGAISAVFLEIRLPVVSWLYLPFISKGD